MTKKQRVSILVIFFGVLSSITGGVFVAAYILEAVVKRMGDPDQSLLFWYLPFLFFGLFVFIIGIVSIGWGIIRLKKIKKGDMKDMI